MCTFLTCHNTNIGDLHLQLFSTKIQCFYNLQIGGLFNLWYFKGSLLNPCCYACFDKKEHTVIRFAWVSAKFDTCTIVSVNGTLVEDKMRRFKGDCAHFSLALTHTKRITVHANICFYFTGGFFTYFFITNTNKYNWIRIIEVKIFLMKVHPLHF